MTPKSDERRYKPGDIVTLFGKKAQIRSVFTDELLGEQVAGAVIIYFPRPGVSGPGYDRVRQDQLEPYHE